MHIFLQILKNSKYCAVDVHYDPEDKFSFGGSRQNVSIIRNTPYTYRLLIDLLQTPKIKKSSFLAP